MKYCKKCVNPDTRPNTVFDADGICAVCRYEAAKKGKKVDWNNMRRHLQEICDWGRANTKCAYDCIVTVSGGKDSTKQAFYARDELKMRPLLVSCVYPPEQLVERGAHNLSSLVAHGFDTVSISLNPQIWKSLIRESFFRRANIFVAPELALYAIPIHAAIAYKIPLVFYGENPALFYGESPAADGKIISKAGYDASSTKHSNTLRGGSAKNIAPDWVASNDTHFYEYPSDVEMDMGNLRLIYLGYFIEEWSLQHNGEFARQRGLKTREEPPEKIGDLWGISGLDEDFRLVNQMLRYLKFGAACVTDQVVELITRGNMSREEGFDLVRKYDGKCDGIFIDRFCRYLGITSEQFWEVAETARNKDIWEKDKNGNWKLKVDDEVHYASAANHV